MTITQAATPAAFSLASATPQAKTPSGDEKLQETARNFEAAFLAEALGHMGLDAAKGVQGAGAFSSFVNKAYAEQLVDQGGIGLSESIVRALAAREETS